MHSSDHQQGTSDEASDDPRAVPPAGNTSSSASPQAAPASAPGGAARANSDWSSNDAVTDFLGLDQEVAVEPDSNTMPAPVDGDAELDPSHSWLLSIEGEGPQSPSRGGAHADPEEAAEENARTKRNTRSTRPSIVRTVVLVSVVGLVLGGAMFGWVRWQEKNATAPDNVATLPKPPTPTTATNTKRPPKKPPVDTSTQPVGTTPTPTTDPTNTATTASTTPTTTDPAPADPNATTPPPADPLAATTSTTEPVAEAPRYEAGARWSDERVARFLARFTHTDVPGTGRAREIAPLAFLAPQFGIDPVHSSFGGATNAISDWRAEDLEAGANPRRTRALRPNGRSHLRLASEADLASIWEGRTVPLDAVAKSVRLLTPQVGRVRILIHGGEVFEGRLYAVGQSHLWLDTDLGRMALASNQMASIEHLSSPDGTPSLGAAGSQALDGLPRVRVRTLGGVLYGRLIGREQRNVTLVTDGGARITVESDDIEPAPVGRSLIVRGTERAPGDS